MGRPRKKPEFNADISMRQTIQKVVDYFGDAYDDRNKDDGSHVSLRSVAEEFDMSILKARKMLITAHRFSTATSRQVQRYEAEGKSISEIIEITGLSRASVHSYLPYSKLVYNMNEVSVDADRKKLQRERDRICREFSESVITMPTNKAEEQLWEILKKLQGCVFHTSRGLRFKYTIKGGELFVDRKKDSITKATVFMAFHKVQKLSGNVTGPKKLGTFGASYLYPIFQRIGIIKSE